MGNGASAKSPRDSNQAKKDKNKNNKKSKRKLQTQKSVHSWDAMISYSHQDTDEMLKLKSKELMLESVTSNDSNMRNTSQKITTSQGRETGGGGLNPP